MYVDVFNVFEFGVYRIKNVNLNYHTKAITGLMFREALMIGISCYGVTIPLV